MRQRGEKGLGVDATLSFQALQQVFAQIADGDVAGDGGFRLPGVAGDGGCGSHKTLTFKSQLLDWSFNMSVPAEKKTRQLLCARNKPPPSVEVPHVQT